MTLSGKQQRKLFMADTTSDIQQTKRARLDATENGWLLCLECPAKPKLNVDCNAWVPAEVSIHNLFATPLPTRFILERLTWSRTRENVSVRDVKTLCEEHFDNQLDTIFDVGRNILGHYLRCLLRVRLWSSKWTTKKQASTVLQVLSTCQCCYCLQEYLEHANYMCGEAFEEMWTEFVMHNSLREASEEVDDQFQHILEYMHKHFAQTTLAARIRGLADKKKGEFTRYLWNHISKHGLDQSKVKHGCEHVY